MKVSPPSRGAQETLRPGAYLVTGGLSGVGLAVAARLADRGCRSLTLMSRSAPGPEATSAIEALRARGVDVSVARGDVSVRQDAARVIGAIAARGNVLRGVVHAAGVIDDGVLEQLDWPRFAGALAPKVEGAWHLHELTRALPLDVFAMCSSLASVTGSPGQGNYAAANAFLDALAHARRAAGLPATTVNWGAWAETGMALRGGTLERAAAHGLGAMKTVDALDALERVLLAGRAQCIVADVDWALFVPQFGEPAPPLFRRVLSDRGEGARPDAAATEAAALVDAIRRAPESARPKLLATFVRGAASRVLGGDAATLDGRQPLHEAGLDSLMAVELRNALGAAIGADLPSTLLFDYPTIDALAAHLLPLVAPSDGRADSSPQAAADPGAGRVVDRIGELSDEEVDRLLAERLTGGSVR